MDDEIIYSWCFNSVECFDSTPSAAIIVLVKNLESFSSLKSQQDALQEVGFLVSSPKMMNLQFKYISISRMFHLWIDDINDK